MDPEQRGNAYLPSYIIVVPSSRHFRQWNAGRGSSCTWQATAEAMREVESEGCVVVHAELVQFLDEDVGLGDVAATEDRRGLLHHRCGPTPRLKQG